MGGTGSTRWSDHKKKRTTEESWILDFDSLAHNQERCGILRPVKISGRKTVFRVRYSLESSETDPVLVIGYVHDRSAQETIEQRIRLCSTQPNFGGRRWYFSCPLSQEGEPCLQRIGKLYLPPGEERFGCRACHNLTYKSSQRSGYYDAICRLLADEDEGERFEFLKRAFQDQIREARSHALKNPPLTLIEVFDREFG